MRGGEWFEIEETGEEFWWPRCHIPGCVNFICLGKSTRFCWPHSGSGESLDEMLERYKEKEAVE
jgi:hypothetical protein